MQRECTCKICGKMFVANRKDARFCSKECSYEHHKAYVMEWNRKNRGRCNERQRERRAEKREAKKGRKDTIVAIGYADRQMAETLKMAGKVDINLEAIK